MSEDKIIIKEEKIIIKPLGAGNEVGRSCIHVKYGNKELLLDCGVHPAYTGVSSLPFLDLVDLSKIDAILVTHFHLDHAAALPFLTEKTNFKGKVFMTHPTKAILRWLLNDYIRVINSSSEQDFYSEQDLENCYNRITPIDYHQQINLDGIKFSALNAGHVLGAAMFLLHFGKSTMLYTGDFSREEDRHLKAAESPGCELDALITEATYGVQCHIPREERESRFTTVVSDVVERGGKCLLPVFALGRAQELLLILEEFWEANKHLQNIPIYYISALARRCMTVYQTYINMMNERIQKISLTRNPFDFKYVRSLKDIGSGRGRGYNKEKDFYRDYKMDNSGNNNYGGNNYGNNNYGGNNFGGNNYGGNIANYSTPHNNNTTNIPNDDESLPDGPCVVMASPGMLQSGCSRELFEKSCQDPKNGVVIPGYCVEGTLAKEILSEPKEIESCKGGMLKLNMSVEYISFSAHVDYTQNSQFIDECKPKNLFFVHGEMNEMMRLKNTINIKNEKNNVEMKLFALRNGEEGSFEVLKDDTAKIYSDKEEFKAILISGDDLRIVDCDDLGDELKKNEAYSETKNTFQQYIGIS